MRSSGSSASGAGRHDLVERPPLDQLHGEERNAAVFFDRVDGDDVGMIQGCDCLSLALESLPALGVRSHERGEDLQRHLPLQLRVLGDEDLPHAALAERRHDPVVIQLFGD